MPCPEITTGRVEVPGEDYQKIQQAADAGQNLWRLSPVRTAQVVATENFGFRERDSYTFVEQYYDPGSGLQHAVVRVVHKPCTYLLELYQPVTQGPRGIWILNEITEL